MDFLRVSVLGLQWSMKARVCEFPFNRKVKVRGYRGAKEKAGIPDRSGAGGAG